MKECYFCKEEISDNTTAAQGTIVCESGLLTRITLHSDDWDLHVVECDICGYRFTEDRMYATPHGSKRFKICDECKRLVEHMYRYKDVKSRFTT